jgi:peptide/nickel transport system permease protein
MPSNVSTASPTPASPTPAAAAPLAPPTAWQHARHVLAENPVTLAAALLFALFVLTALVGPALVPHDPLATNAGAALQPPSAAHWFGTDALGRDIFSRTVVATRLDLGIAVAAVALSFVVGLPLGLAAGFFGGWWDAAVTRLSDTIMAFPLFVLAMGIVAALGNTVGNIVLATAIINLPFYVRVARAETNVRRAAGFVEAARLAGNSEWRILGVHLLPNILPPAMVQVSLNMGWAILNAAGLSFIGLGVRPPTPEWGILVAEGAQFIVSGEWWVSFFPGAVLMLAVFSFNLLGDALRDLLDPRRRT